MRRTAEHALVVPAMVLPCAEEAGWITGQTVSVDGGASLMGPSFSLEPPQ